MNKLFLEAKGENTPEAHFLKALLSLLNLKEEVTFICMNGIDNLFHETIRNQMLQAQTDGEQVIILADADTAAKGWGFCQRNADIEARMEKQGLKVPYFLYPNHEEDGDVETLIEAAACRDKHQTFFDCFEDYERCVSGDKDPKTGKPRYQSPNLKGKLHTYISAQPLSSKQRNKIGAGDWLFSDTTYWNLNDPALQPLKDFLTAHFR